MIHVHGDINEESQNSEDVKIGFVTNCKKLNVREKPKTDSATEEFYKVFTVAGIEGFCMKNFITIQK
jgi:hypothetical protein